MRKQLAIEFRRLLKSPQLYIALAIGIFIAISQIIQTTLPLAEANKSGFYLEQKVIPHSLFTCMLGMGRGSFSWQDSLLKNLIPILAALPFGISYYIDKKTGYVNSIYIRERKGEYLTAKYIVTFVSGGFVTAIPVLVNFIGTAMVVPLINPIKGTHYFVNVADFLQSIYYNTPVIYILIVCLLYFIIGGLFATMCLGATYLVDMMFLVQLFPVIFVYLYNMLVGTVHFLGLDSTYSILSTEIDQNMTIGKLLIFLAIISVFSILYFYKGLKEEL